MNWKSIQIVVMLLCLLAVGGAQAQRATYVGSDGKTYVKLMSKQPAHAVVDSGYDPELLIPHLNRKTEKWGYMRRDSKELVVPHRFERAGRYARGFAIATELGPDGHGTENVYRIDGDGHVQFLLEDTVTREWPAEVRRLSDDYIEFIDHDRIRYIDPKGQVVLDTIIPYHEHRFEYTFEGHYLLWNEGSFQFRSFTDGLISDWDMNRFALHANREVAEDETPEFLTFYIYDSQMKRVGILSNRGVLIVPFVWEKKLNATEATKLEENFAMYVPCADSLFIGYRENHYFLVHLDGRIIFEYPATLFPYPCLHDPWRKKGLLFAYMKSDDGTFQDVILNPKTNEILFQCRCFVNFIGENQVFEGHTSGFEIFSLDDGSKLKFNGLGQDRRLSLRESIITPTQSFWIVEVDGQKNKFGVIDDKGELVIPIEFWDMNCLSYYRQNYQTIHAIRIVDNIKIHSYYTPKGELLFGTEFIEASFPQRRKNAMPLAVVDRDANRHLQPLFLAGEYHPNMLLYTKLITKNKKPLMGYMDAVGNRYF